jgi:hypothetical protein
MWVQFFFVPAGLLACPFSCCPSRNVDALQWQMQQNHSMDLQQRELLRIFTGFPFQPRASGYLNSGKGKKILFQFSVIYFYLGGVAQKHPYWIGSAVYQSKISMQLPIKIIIT